MCNLFVCRLLCDKLNVAYTRKCRCCARLFCFRFSHFSVASCFARDGHATGVAEVTAETSGGEAAEWPREERQRGEKQRDRLHRSGILFQASAAMHSTEPQKTSQQREKRIGERWKTREMEEKRRGRRAQEKNGMRTTVKRDRRMNHMPFDSCEFRDRLIFKLWTHESIKRSLPLSRSLARREGLSLRP